MNDNGDKRVVEISIVDNQGKTLFTEEGVRYEIPIYQRAFAWGTESNDINHGDEVLRLMNDIRESDGGPYYIGSMVVHKKDDNNGVVKYEVIDGQQRLTALFIILSCLNWQLKRGKIDSSFNELKIGRVLKYRNREFSQKAIDNLDGVIKTLNEGGGDITIKEEQVDNRKEVRWLTSNNEKLESSICDAVKRVFDQFDKENDYSKQLLEGLKKVVLYRIEVPEDTDLNLYFEIMNVRGEQLEESDIVKARLMEVLKNDTQKECFARIWNACYDMTGYVQMNFERKERDLLFGEQWDQLPNDDKTNKYCQYYKELIDRVAGEENSEKDSIESTMLSAILKPNAGVEFGKREQDDDAEKNTEFGGIIDFNHFLLHVLLIYKKSRNATKPLEISRQLNEKLLAREFEDALREVEEQAKSDWAWNFMLCLLKCRYLLDRYFIKREYNSVLDNGEWCIMSLRKSKDSCQLQKTNGNENNGKENKRCLMIESCLRVTYTDLKTMHWITMVLDWIYCECESRDLPSISDVANECEAFARKTAEAELNTFKNYSYRMGTRTHNLLFNYLDYLLWKDKEYQGNNQFDFNAQDFAFEFRTSVEHWYPQHPDKSIIASWKDGVGENEERRLDRDGFGNLCLIHAKENSHFSNLPPSAKARYLPEKMKDHCGLKCQLMVNLTDNSEHWKKVSFKHGKEMLDVLAKDVGDFDLELEKYGWRE